MEAQSLCQADHGHLWGISLCGPIMFVDPRSRSIIASDPDAEGALKAEGGIFVGSLPADQTIANTAVEWSGVRWTQMVWPLPGDERQRYLMAHELFHRIQNRLNLPKVEGGENAQLDTLLQPLDKAGTVYPNMRISDDWGILEAKNGALMKSDWSAVIVTAPSVVTGTSLNGDGWTLKLDTGWKIVPDVRKGDFRLASGS